MTDQEKLAYLKQALIREKDFVKELMVGFPCQIGFFPKPLRDEALNSYQLWIEQIDWILQQEKIEHLPQ